MFTYFYTVTGIRGGDAPEVADLVRDRIDTELEMAKSLMQQEFEETFESEQVSLASMTILPGEGYFSTSCPFFRLPICLQQNTFYLSLLLLLYGFSNTISSLNKS
jgi:hypothetical protein